MKKRPVLLTLALLCLLTLGLSTGTLSRYMTTVEKKVFDIQSESWNPADHILTAEEAATLSPENGVLTVPEFFFKPSQESSAEEGSEADPQGTWCRVTGIGVSAFADHPQITGIQEIVLPNSVGSIGDSAFAGCSAMTEINLPSGLTTIGAYAFQDSGLTSIEIPASLTTLGVYALSCDLDSITVNAANENFEFDNGELYSQKEENTLYRSLNTGKNSWYNAIGKKVIPGAFSYSGYTAIVSNDYHKDAWGASPAVIFNTQHLDNTITGISGSTTTGYTITLETAVLTDDIVYHLDHHPTDGTPDAKAGNKVLKLDGTTSEKIEAEDCQPCTDHKHCVQITLSSYMQYAYGVLRTDGTLEIHNCYVTQTEDGVIHQYKNGDHADLTAVYALPDFGGSVPNTGWDNVFAWSALAKADVKAVKVIDPIELTENDSTAAWFTGMINAVTMDLEKLSAISDGSFSGLTSLKAVFYKGDTTKAPWGAEGALIIDNQLGVDVSYKSESDGAYTFSASELTETKVLIIKTGGAYTVTEVVAEQQFTVPSDAYGIDRCVTLAEAKTYRFATTDDSHHLRIYEQPYVYKPGEKVTEGDTSYTVKNVYSWPNGYDAKTGEGEAVYSQPKNANGEVYPAWVTDITTYPSKTAEVFSEVTVKNEIHPTTLNSWFYGFSSCAKFNLANLKTDNVTNYKQTFRGCSKLDEGDLGTLNGGVIDLTNVTTTEAMFRGCSGLMDFAGITFIDSSASVGDSDSGNDSDSDSNGPKLTNLSYMFMKCENLTTFNISMLPIDTSHAVKLKGMFSECTGLKNVEYSDDLKIANIESAAEMFFNCKSLVTLDISFLEAKTNIGQMFANCTNLTTIYASTSFGKGSGSDDGASAFHTMSTKLVGGNGTQWVDKIGENVEGISGKRACIDGGTSNPGYFTEVGDFKLQSAIEGVSIYSRTENKDTDTYTVVLDNSAGGTLPTNAAEITVTVSTPQDGGMNMETTVNVDTFDATSKTLTFTLTANGEDGKFLPGTQVTISGALETVAEETPAPASLEVPTVYQAPTEPTCDCETRCSETVRNDSCPVCARDYLSCSGSGQVVYTSCSCAFYCDGINQQPCDACLIDPSSCEGENWFP